MSRPFVNWSGSLAFTPSGYAEPADEDEVRELVLWARESGNTLRPVGSGHSSSPLVRTDGTLVSSKMIPLQFRTAMQPYPTDIREGKLYQLIENDDEEWELHAWPL